MVAAEGRPARGRRDELEQARLGVARLAARHLGAHDVARHRAAHEHDEAVEAGEALTAVGEGVDGELEDVAGLRGHARPV